MVGRSVEHDMVGTRFVVSVESKAFGRLGECKTRVSRVLVFNVDDDAERPRTPSAGRT